MKNKLKFSVDKISTCFCYILMIMLYFGTEKLSRMSSGSKDMFEIMGHQLPISPLAGAFSSMSMIVLICLVIFYRKLGFYTSIVILAVRLLKLTKGLLLFHPTGLPAIFITLMGLISVLVIYQRNEKILCNQEKYRKELTDFTNSIIDAFSICIDGKDSYTNGHSLRVAKYTKLLALKLGEGEETAQKFYNIALLHDIGKIGISDEILNKPGKLTPEEYETMKTHTYRGFEILKRVKTQKDIADGAQYHHERFDGRGYPAKLSGEKIPWVARIISVADAFDAMSSTRPYRKRLSNDAILKEIKDCTGTQFDPVVAKAFLELYEEGVFSDVRTE